MKKYCQFFFVAWVSFLMALSISFGNRAFGADDIDYKELQACKRRVYLDYKRKIIQKNEAIDRLQDCRASAAYTKALKECKSNIVSQYKADQLNRDQARSKLKECPVTAKNIASQVKQETQEMVDQRNNCLQAVVAEWVIHKTIDKETAQARMEDCKLGPESFQGCSQAAMAELRTGKISEDEAKRKIAQCMMK